MKTHSTRTWRRLATLRAARRRGTELPLPTTSSDAALPLPPLEPPDDDREFLTPPAPGGGLRLEAA